MRDSGEIALQVQNGLDTATPIRQAKQDEQNNALAAENLLQQHYATLDSREKSRLTSTVAGAAQLGAFLDNNDLEGAKNFLTQRRATLHSRMASGENIDTEDTDAALQMLQDGRIDELKNGVQGLMAAGKVYGLLKNTNPGDTAGGDTGVLLDRMVADQHKQGNTSYGLQDALKDLKGGAGQAGKNAANIDTGGAAADAVESGKNASDERYASGIKSQEEQGKGAGQKIIANNETLGNLNNLNYSIQQAAALLPKVSMTGPIMGRIGNAAEDPDYKNLQGAINSITLQAKDLYNLGSGAGFTDSDRDFLRQVIAGDYAKPETIQAGLQRFQEALQHRQQFLQEQNKQYGEGNTNYMAAGQPNAQPAQPQPSGKRVRVSNGKETFEIDANDLQAAMQEGFQQQ